MACSEDDSALQKLYMSLPWNVSLDQIAKIQVLQSPCAVMIGDMVQFMQLHQLQASDNSRSRDLPWAEERTSQI